MEITKSKFDDFWQNEGMYINLNNKNRLYTNLLKEIEKNNTVDGLDEYVSSLKTRRETVRKIVVALYEFIAKKENCTYSSALKDKKYYDVPFERQLEIAKYLHKGHDRNDIMEHFEIDARTLNKDLNALEAGINVGGSLIKIDRQNLVETRDGRKREIKYRTTIHPIFLPLNLTEVCALVTCLDKMSGVDKCNAEIYKDLSNRVKSQLSTYAVEKLKIKAEPHDNAFVDEQEYIKAMNAHLMYYLKTQEKCNFVCNNEEYSGSVKFDSKIYIELDNGERMDIGSERIFIKDFKYD